ncbi:MAG: ParB N-terminal domain-containing protein, partial [Candidatus Desulfaltia sp.]|nr:ParB N-terminal domain-containing protein [Candidatus Desulfaltia sp.]
MLNNMIHDVKIAQISVSKLNVRVENATTGIDELAASIKKHGLLQPVVLLGSYGTPPYELIAGQRRFLAHQL